MLSFNWHRSRFAWLRPLTFAVASLIAAMGASAATSTDLSKCGISLTVETSADRVDVARDFEVTVTAVAPAGSTVALPDLRDRFRGFSIAEDFADDPLVGADGGTTYVSRWRLVPKPCEKAYKLAPFVVTVTRGGQGQPSSGGNAEPSVRESFYTSPVYFEGPAAREIVTGGMEVDPKKDLPPLTWALVWKVALALAAMACLALAIWYAVKKIMQKVREHRMSPIERAMLELDRLLKKGLPGRGRYKDFYVELTMVVRRYIQRRHSVRAPNLTTDEFLRAAAGNPAFTKESIAELRNFLESADMVKFAGVEATPEMADSATDKAKGYLSADSRGNRESPKAGGGR